MPKLTGPLFSVRAGGTLGGAITYKGSNAGARVERVPRHRDKKSGAQLGQRSLFQEAVAYWKALTAEAKAGYNETAEVLGMTGYQYALKLYLLGALAPVVWRGFSNGFSSGFYKSGGA